jgi:hypothetical protein
MNTTLNETGGASMVVEYVRLPDVIEPGRYDAFGRKDPDGNLLLGIGSGICHMWAVFKNGLRPGQIGSMTFSNVPGSYALTGNFTEWQPGPSGYSPHAVQHKMLGDPLGTPKPRPREIPAGTKPMDIEAGEWEDHVSVYENGPDQPPTEVIGAEVNTLMRNIKGDAWIAHSYNAIFHGFPFAQHGIWGYDPNTDNYHGSFVKTVQSNLSVFEGDYDETTHTLTLMGETRNCFGKTDDKGVIYKVTEKRIINYQDMDTKTMEVWQEDPPGEGKFVRRDHVLAKRRVPLKGGNVPRLADSPLTLIALQRGVHLVKVVGQNTTSSHRWCAAGMVMLGPQWLNIFSDALRL